MVRSKKIAIPSSEMSLTLSTIDVVCDRRLKAASSDTAASVVESVRSALKTKVEKISAGDDSLDAKSRANSEVARRCKRVREEIESTSTRIAELRERVPNMANDIVGKENQVKDTQLNLKDIQSEGMTDEERKKAFSGMKETLDKLERNLEEVGREMPEKLESLQVREREPGALRQVDTQRNKQWAFSTQQATSLHGTAINKRQHQADHISGIINPSHSNGTARTIKHE